MWLWWVLPTVSIIHVDFQSCFTYSHSWLPCLLSFSTASSMSLCYLEKTVWIAEVSDTMKVYAPTDQLWCYAVVSCALRLVALFLNYECWWAVCRLQWSHLDHDMAVQKSFNFAGSWGLCLETQHKLVSKQTFMQDSPALGQRGRWRRLWRGNLHQPAKKPRHSVCQIMFIFESAC